MPAAASGVLIDSDNALGSSMGDVDDAFAITALLRSPLSIVALSSVAGNTSEKAAFANNSGLVRLLGFGGPVLRGAEVAAFLSSRPPVTVLALGPLTNVAAAIRSGAVIERVVLVGGTLSTRGRWPPWWPHEFNLTRDRQSTLDVFRSGVPLTIFPLDVARQLAIRRADIARISGAPAAFLHERSRRWFTRLRLLKGTGRFPIYDLAAALYLISPELFVVEQTTMMMDSNTHIRFGEGSRPAGVCRSFVPQELWSSFERLLSQGFPSDEAGPQTPGVDLFAVKDDS